MEPYEQRRIDALRSITLLNDEGPPQLDFVLAVAIAAARCEMPRELFLGGCESSFELASALITCERRTRRELDAAELAEWIKSGRPLGDNLADWLEARTRRS